ncbi:GNAT family N-acetyltransferase [Amycolatopsis sp. NPDC051903]|uniref:GNAT family N-acetyltransferase n=1 Tax=Amycolatopsis sp. NPDC051903 TaxID=3363936 RepID=UPI0037948CB1
MFEGPLTWRPLTREDAQASADLLNAMETVDGLGENYTAQDTLQELIDPYTDLERASLAAFDGDVLVGFMKIQFKPPAEEVHRVFLDGGVHPGYRRRGVGTTLVEAGVTAAKAVHARHHPASRLAVDVHKAEQIAGVAELVRSQGFVPVRYFQRVEHPLGDALPAVVVPEGLVLEPWSPENAGDFLATRNAAYRDHWGAAPMTLDAWQNKITNHTFRPELSFLLRHGTGGAAAGVLVTLTWEGDVALTGIRDAHFMVIGTRREDRNRGVASALIAHALRGAAAEGYDRASANVDSSRPFGGAGLFERARFVAARRFVRWALEV